MINFSEVTSVSTKDSQRLKDSFFSPPKKERKYFPSKKKRRFILVPLILILLVSFLAIIFLNFNIFIIPHNKPLEGTKSLLSNEQLLSINFLSNTKAQIKENIIYMNLPWNKPTGFILNFKNKVNLSHTPITLIINNPKVELNLSLIVRDNRFFSNAVAPLKFNIFIHKREEKEIVVPISLDKFSLNNVNISRVNQIRFVFFQKAKENLPLFVKDIIIKERR